MKVVGIFLVHNEDVFVEQAIRNVAAFCDRIVVADHMSTDRTWDAVRALAREYDHVEARRIRRSGDSHAFVEGYAGTETWAFKPDGDELFDPEGLRRFREELLDGAYRDRFRLVPGMLHCVELDRGAGLARGYLSPPSRAGGKLFNFAAIDSWTGCQRERLLDGEIAFRNGYHSESVIHLGQERGWDETPFRALHACFLRRSSREPEAGGAARPNIDDSAIYRRGLLGGLERLVRRRPEPQQSAWKNEKYRRGELVTVDASPFLP
jgi:glycosyltransferase involved in cell wall biosynthesis